MPKSTIRLLLTCVAALMALGSAITPAAAQTYPSRPVTILVSLAAGTGMDTIVRMYGQKLSQKFGQPVVIENRPGAAGLATVEGVLNAPPDGHTIGVTTSSAFAIRPTLFKKLSYRPADLAPLSVYLKSPFLLVVNPSLPVNSAKELVAYVKERPGKLSYSSPSIGGLPHLVGEYLQLRFGFNMAHVPYRNSPQAIADVAAGHVPITVAELGASLPLIRDGKLRALAVTSSSRVGPLPDVPTVAEATGLDDFEMVSWHVLFSRADLPQNVKDRLQSEMTALMKTPEVTAVITKLGLIPQLFANNEETRKYVDGEIDKWSKLVTSIGLAASH
jgi:tripartite-type tricarboxylate transporter receptor subunit TctC